MTRAPSAHGAPDPRTHGILIDHGRSHDLLTAAFFGGRRPHDSAASSSART